MKGFSKNMMDIFFRHLVVDLSPDLQVGALAARAETVVSLEEYLVRQAVLVDIALYNFEQGSVSAGKTGTSETDNDLSSLIHWDAECAVKLRKIENEPNLKGQQVNSYFFVF